MAGINTETARELMKTRLNRMGADPSLELDLTSRLEAAAEELKGAGINLTDTSRDLVLLVDTAVWQYQSRDKNTGMPDWLRLRRRERWLQEHRRGST